VDVHISGRHVRITEPMERRIREHAAKLPRLDGRIQYLVVTLNVDSGDQAVELVAKCHRADLVAAARSHDMYQSIDEAFAKIERQIARCHDKLLDSHARGD